MSLIDIENLRLQYGAKTALAIDSLSLPEKQIVGIVGPNGSGKTTLLKSIMGLIKPSSGSILVFNKAIAESLSKISYVPQRESIDWNFPLNVFDVVLMGRYNAKSIFRASSKKDKSIALEAIKKLGIEDLKDKQIGQLSGGQQQRTLIARAIARGADLFLMDEPFAGVDATTEQIVLGLFKSMTDEGKSIVLVHHDLYAAEKYFDHIVLLNNNLIAAGPAKEILKPEMLAKAYGNPSLVNYKA